MNTIKFSKNKKLNMALTGIYDDMKLNFSECMNDITRYKKDFSNEIDYNIAQYGNLLCYYSDIKDFYRACGYKTLDKMSDQKVWDIYKRQVGYIARKYFD